MAWVLCEFCIKCPPTQFFKSFQNCSSVLDFLHRVLVKIWYEYLVIFIVNAQPLHIFWELLKVSMCSWIKDGNRNWPTRKVTNHTPKIYLSSIGIIYSLCKSENYLIHGVTPYKHVARKWTTRKVINHIPKFYLSSRGIY